MSKDLCDFEGHPDEVIAIQWHPFKEEIFASACKAGQISFWK
jgi:WD40 repeat protein